MSIPLDRLYHYIENIAEEIYGDTVIIYRFFPHGSKKLSNLTQLQNQFWIKKDLALLPNIYCYDQEPLNYDLYQNYVLEPNFDFPEPEHTKNLQIYYNGHSPAILIHSEQRSANLIKYQQNQFVTVYYWAHALIALDWYRYAGHVKIEKKPNKLFLIYNRAWINTREYRLKFADLLIEQTLTQQCQTLVAYTDQQIPYFEHKFENPIWQPSNKLENYFENNQTSSCYSADFDIADYQNTHIEVVLETLFDDDRLHLTEKSLRPIACGQPFILCATHGSLAYLRSYGFRTFGDVIDESYDEILDPLERLQAVVLTMKKIADWSPLQLKNNLEKLYFIAEHNRQHFFSHTFFSCVTSELKNNLSTAFNVFGVEN